jgi:hypothetical protein
MDVANSYLRKLNEFTEESSDMSLFDKVIEKIAGLR